jgi:ribosomal subunit interface protein
MTVTISVRHCEIPESLRTTTERRINRLSRYHPRLADAEVIFGRERVSHEAEIRLNVAGTPPVIARGAAATFHAALHVALGRVSRQLKRGRERRTTRRAESPAQ